MAMHGGVESQDASALTHTAGPLRLLGSGGVGAPAPIPLLFLITTLDRGGAEKIMLRWAQGLPSAKYAAQVAALQGRSRGAIADLEGTAISIHDLAMAGRGDLRVATRLFHLLRRERIRVLVTFLFHATLVGRVVGALAGVPIRISSERALGGEGPMRRLLNRWTVPFATHVVAVSDLVADYAISAYRIPKGCVTTIVNGVDTKSIAPTVRAFDPSMPVVGCTARLHAENDHATLLRAFARVAAARPCARLVLVGRGPEEARLRQLAARLGIAGMVTFAGEQVDVRPWLAGMDVYVHTSLNAGISNAILEASAAALPVIATAVGGTSEVVVDEETGILAPPRSPHALAAALERFFTDRARAVRLGRAARARMEARFTEAAMLQQVESLVDRLVQDVLGLRFETERGWVPCR